MESQEMSTNQEVAGTVEHNEFYEINIQKLLHEMFSITSFHIDMSTEYQ